MSFNFFRKASPAAAHFNAAHAGDYLTRIKSYPVLSEQEERDLVERWFTHGERKAHDALIQSHLRLVPRIAQKYSGYGVDVADLISEGNVGLVHSLERFDPAKGFRFSTYARWWIKAAILNYILQTWSPVKVGNGANKKRLFFNLRRAKRTLHLDGERYLSDKDVAQLAKHFGVSTEDVIAMDRRMSASDVSMSQPVGQSMDGDSIEFGDTLADDAPTPEDTLVDADDRAWRSEALREAIQKLDDREREILSKRYLTERPATLSKLARIYGLTAERVRQIEAKAILKIKQFMRPAIRRPVHAMGAAFAMFFAATESYAA
jgi:RNA polymerase sigma-32 factor